MSRFIISALGISPPGTMGGNSKIALEMARYLRLEREVHFVIPEGKVPTVTDTLGELGNVFIHTVPDYPGDDKFAIVRAPRFFYPHVKRILDELQPGPDDIVYGCSDAHTDAYVGWRLQRRFHYRWIPSAFLFVPFIVENIRKGYGFPPILYLIGWFYARVYLFFAVRRASGFVITNESDFCHFPRRFRANRLFAYYGGVNIDQIPTIKQSNNQTIKQFSVVFCSRLHPQKGIDGFLDVWKLVFDALHQRPETRDQRPETRNTVSLSIIGNGDPTYESYLKSKAERLGIADSIDWMGYVNNEAKYRIYAQSRLLVHPTVFDNNGMVAAEALCTGLPVVMQDLPALRHVYTTGCVKVPFGDKSAFAAEVVRLLTDPAHYASVAPTPAQVAALRAHWDWGNRAAEFARWLNAIDP